MKHITGFILFFAVMLLCGCDNPTGPDKPNEPEPNNSGKTWVAFANNNDFTVDVYSDYSRLTKIAEVQAQSRSVSIETDPNDKGASFYPTCHIVIEGITVPYQMDAIIDKIDSGKSKEQPNVITIPSLEELSSDKKALPLSASAYIKIENTGSSSLMFQRGNNELKPEGADSTILSGGAAGVYEVMPGPAAGFSLKKNTVDPVSFPEQVTEFSGGRLYSFVFDGAYFTLLVDKPLTIDQVFADKYDDIPPAAPGKPSVVSGMNQLIVKWSASVSAISYEVFINTTPSTPDTPELTTETTGVFIFHLENNKTYYVWVRAVNPNGKSGYSPYAEGIPLVPTTVPAAPSKPSLKAGSMELTASWQLVELASAYEVWYGTSEDSALAVKYGADIPGYTTEASLTGLTNDTRYYVWIKAKNEAGTSGLSPSENAAPNVLAGLPLTPDRPTVTQEDGNILVTWPKAEGALSYELWTGTSNNTEEAQKYGDDISGASVTIGNPADGSVIYLWLKSKNDTGVSGFSEGASIKPLGNPGFPTVIMGYKRMTVTWSEVAGADEYEVYYGADASMTLTVTTAETTAIITGLSIGSTYNIKLRAKNTYGSSAYGPEASGTVDIEPGLYRNGEKFGKQNLNQAFDYISTNAENEDDFVIVLGANEAISPRKIGAYSGTQAFNVTLLGYGAERTISLSGSGVMFQIYEGVTFTLDEKIVLKGSSSTNSSAIVQVSGSFIMDGGIITGNKNSAVYVSSGSFVMNGGTISENTASYYSGGVHIAGSGSFTMNGGTISENTAASYGGGVYIGGSGSFTMNGGTISENTVSYYSGGVHIAGSGSFTMNGGRISENTAANYGGGVHIAGSGSFTMNGGRISENTAASDGGGVYIDGSGSFIMSGGTISGNTASYYGGGVYMASSRSFIMSGGTISGNNTSGFGGGVHVKSGSFIKMPARGEQNSGIIYGSEETGFDAEGIPLKNIPNSVGDAVYVSKFYRDTTAGETDQIDSATGRGLSVNGKPPYGE